MLPPANEDNVFGHVCLSVCPQGLEEPLVLPPRNIPKEPNVLGPPARDIWLANTGDHQAHGSIYINKKYLGEENFTLVTHSIRFNLPAFLALFICYEKNEVTFRL